MKTKDITVLFNCFERNKRKQEKAVKDRKREKEYKQKVGASMERQKHEWGKEL